MSLIQCNPSGFEVQRGLNLSHWFSQDFGWATRDSWIGEEDIRFIAGQGFDHIRIPLDERELWLPSGQLNEPELSRLLRAIDWARQAEMRTIVDLHTLNSHHFNAKNEEGLINTLWSDPAEQQHFIDLWRDLSARLGHLPVDCLAYEILNEPLADRHDQWNDLIAATLDDLRPDEPERVIILGGNMQQIPETLPALAVPAGDPNIILSFHTYAPMLLTHYRAHWTPLKLYTGPVHYPGPIVGEGDYARLMNDPDPRLIELAEDASEDWGATRLRQKIDPAVRRARELGLQLYCGEFGCLPSAPRGCRLAYMRDIISVFESEGIAWASWEYKGEFGIYEWLDDSLSCGPLDNELLGSLMQQR
jgi:endoglucanase